MPPIVGTGRKPQVWACGYCHLPTGWGKPENANVSNLPEPYFLQTVADFKNGSRRGTVPDILPHSGMVAAIMPTTDAEVREAYHTFAKNKLTMQRYKVTEATMVPKTKVQAAGCWRQSPVPVRGWNRSGSASSRSQRSDLTTLRDWRIGFTTYVPPGSIKKGEALVTTGGNGKTVQCTICHGADLRASVRCRRSEDGPDLHLPSLYDFKDGARHGAWSQMMKPVVQNLTLTT
jgi:cytochrome c553